MSLLAKKWSLLLVVLSFFVVGVYWFTAHRPQTASGIEGTITYGPLCPGSSDTCSIRLTYNFDIIALYQDGSEAGRTRPDAIGQYKLAIAPGTYGVKASRSFASTLGNPLSEATVTKGKFTHRNLSFDTGIR